MDNITFDFEIDAFGVHNDFGGKKNVIYEIRTFLCCTLTEGDTSGTRKQLFVIHIPVDNLNNFVEYENVTKELATSWLEKHQSDNYIEDLKRRMINDLYPKQQYLKPNF